MLDKCQNTSFQIFNWAIFEVKLNQINVTFFWTPLSNGDVLFGLLQCSLDSLRSSSAKVGPQTVNNYFLSSFPNYFSQTVNNYFLCREATLSTSPIYPCSPLFAVNKILLLSPECCCLRQLFRQLFTWLFIYPSDSIGENKRLQSSKLR